MKIICINKKHFFTGIILSIIFLSILAIMFNLGNYAITTATKERSIPIYSVERDDKKIAITFDCAWGTEHTDSILKTLDAYNIKATFFTVQFWTERYPSYIKLIHEKGHEIGTHSKTHSHMSKLSVDKIKEELNSSAKAIERIIDKKINLFRPPYGDYNNDLINTSNESGFFPIQWSVDSLDWKNISAEQIKNRVVKSVLPGDIILCHNNGLHTSEALPLIINNLKNKGYEFVTISELIYKKNYYIDTYGKQHSNL